MQIINNINTKYTTKYTDIFESIEKRVRSGNSGCTVLVPHICNNLDIFDIGFAKLVANKYPSVKENYHMLGKTFLKNNLGHCQFLNIYEDPKHKYKLCFVNMIAQNGIHSPKNTRPLNYAALVKCMINVSQFITLNTDFHTDPKSIEIHAPKFGIGLAGGNWNFISDLIEDIWSKYTVYIYSLKK